MEDNTYKKLWIDMFTQSVHREGADKLLAWLEKSDFFTAPASTRYHLSEPGGLCQHSVHVYQRLYNIMKCVSENKGETLTESQIESIAIVALLHDVCKTNFYATETRNRKNEQGKWEQYAAYTVKDTLPYGHGEKSVYIVSGFMRLTREEAFAIRFHMGAFAEGDKNLCGQAYEMFPLAMYTHFADMEATHIDEVK